MSQLPDVDRPNWQADPARFSRQGYPHSGRSGFKLGQIALGSVAQLWRQGRRSHGLPRCCAARSDSGIIHLDLANNYGPAPGPPRPCSARC